MSFQLTANTWVDDNGQIHDGTIIASSPSQPVYVPTAASVSPLQVSMPLQVATSGSQLNSNLVNSQSVSASSATNPTANVPANILDLYQATGEGIPVSILNSGVYQYNSPTADPNGYSANSIPIWSTANLAVNSSVPATLPVTTANNSILLSTLVQTPIIDLAILGLIAWWVIKK